MNKGITWRGKYYLQPQSASYVDSSALSPVQLGQGNRLAILGDFIGLIPPKTAYKVGSPSEALTLLHPNSEEARLAVQLAFNPSKGIPGASELYLIPVNPATRAAATFSSVLTLTSYLYGLPANLVKAKVETGTTGKKVTIGFQDQTETFDNLTKSSFSIEYTGAGSAATMTIDITAATHLLTTSCTGAAGDDLSLDLTVYTTVQALLDAINATGKYTATAVTASPLKDLTLQLDAVAAQDIKTTAYTAKADLQAIIDGINKTSGYVVASRVTDAGAVPANVGWTYLSGGVNGATANSDWQSSFDLLKTMDIDLVLPLTSSASIHAMGDAHCQYMSGPNGKSERRQFVGGALQTWVSEANRTTAIAALVAAFKALNSDRTVHVGLGSKAYDADGNIKLYPAYVAASMYAGIAAGASVVEPLTNKYLNCLGLEVDLRTTEIDTLLEAGGAVPVPDNVQGAGYVISRQLTTWNQDADLYRIEFSVGRGADYIAREVRKRHALLIGKPGTEALDTTIINLTNAVLEAAKRNELIRSYDPKQTQLRVEGTVRYVDYSAQPILPVNYIFSTYHLLPTSLTITL